MLMTTGSLSGNGGVLNTSLLHLKVFKFLVSSSEDAGVTEVLTATRSSGGISNGQHTGYLG